MAGNHRSAPQSDPDGSGKTEVIRGVLDHITFHSDDTGYTIARLAQESGPPITIIGTLSSLNLGETIEVRGEWTRHPTYGEQFRVESYRQVLPSSVEGIKRYLGSGLIRGLGPVIAEKIVEHFGDRTLDVIEKHPGRLSEVEGIGPKRVKQIREAWHEHEALRDVMVFLQGHGVNPSLAHKIYRRYGSDAVAIVRKDPYRLSSDIWGVGFRTADSIAGEVGITAEDPRRLRAGLAYVVSRSTEHGNTFVPAEELVTAAADQLGVGLDLIESALDEAVVEGTLRREEDRVSLPDLADAESEAAERLSSVMRLGRAGMAPAADEAVVRRAEERTGVTYAPRQAEAILAAMKSGALVVTGGPGTGKTTTTRAIVSELAAAGVDLALCAPTGRAAKRLTEVTGREAQTIHRLLSFQPESGTFAHDQGEPLMADVILVDEASMVDTRLFVHLLRGMKPTARLILVGDADQLPSVGPGQVLRDVIASGVVPVVRLSTVFRQASESRIITNAHRINEGAMPDLRNAKDGDFFFLEMEQAAEAAETIADLVARRLPERYGLDPVRDIQVLAPMYRGETGANALNDRLQEALNPHGDGITRGRHTYRAGDKVIVTRNNYTKMVFNGDIGRIRHVDTESGQIHVDLDLSAEGSTSAVYESHETDEIVLAYAVSVHRSQGSEFPVVVLPVTTEHYMMLQRNVLYTAVTRARQMLVMVGSKRAVALAVNNSTVRDRNTWLAERLRAVGQNESE